MSHRRPYRQPDKRAFNRFVAASKQTVALFAKQLQPAAPAEPGLIEKLIEHLDSGEFKARQQAHSQLLQIGDETAIHEALTFYAALRSSRQTNA